MGNGHRARIAVGNNGIARRWAVGFGARYPNVRIVRFVSRNEQFKAGTLLPFLCLRWPVRQGCGLRIICLGFSIYLQIHHIRLQPGYGTGYDYDVS